MKYVYLIWERQSYCDYDVIYATLDKSEAEKFINELGGGSNRFILEEMELDKEKEVHW